MVGKPMGGPGGSEGQWVCCFGDHVNGLTGLAHGILIWCITFHSCPLPERLAGYCEVRD